MENIENQNNEKLQQLEYGFSNWKIYDYLEAALDNHAEEKLAHLPDWQRKLVQKQAQWIYSVLTDFHVSSKDSLAFANIRETTVNDKDLFYALQLETAWKTIEHVSLATERIARLYPSISQVEPPPVVQKYLKNAVQCYLLGLDLACLFVCRSALEMALKNCLKIIGHPEYEEDRNNKYTAGNMIKVAIEKYGLINRNQEEAWSINQTAKEAIHRGNYQDADLKTIFSVINLSKVLTEVFENVEKIQEKTDSGSET